MGAGGCPSLKTSQSSIYWGIFPSFIVKTFKSATQDFFKIIEITPHITSWLNEPPY